MAEINHYACDQRIAQLEAENAKLWGALERATPLAEYLADDVCMYADPPGCGDCPRCDAVSLITTLAEIKGNPAKS